MKNPVHFDPHVFEIEMTEGYIDGWGDDRPQLPESLANRSASYRHGWLNGQDDRLATPRASAAQIELQASAAIAQDISKARE